MEWVAGVGCASWSRLGPRSAGAGGSAPPPRSRPAAGALRFSRRVDCSASSAAAPPRLDDLVEWDDQPACGGFDGPSFGDGAGTHRDCTLRRCGWSVAQIVDFRAGDNVSTSVVVACYGPHPFPLQEVLAAEAYAFFAVLEVLRRHCRTLRVLP